MIWYRQLSKRVSFAIHGMHAHKKWSFILTRRTWQSSTGLHSSVHIPIINSYSYAQCTVQLQLRPSRFSFVWKGNMLIQVNTCHSPAMYSYVPADQFLCSTWLVKNYRNIKMQRVPYWIIFCDSYNTSF